MKSMNPQHRTYTLGHKIPAAGKSGHIYGVFYLDTSHLY
jgi:hypothetical protein